MFDTRKTGAMIKEARIAQNMTQMGLADEMQVSFQAVSNWERGNSLPDIAKIGQLCQVLHISVEELLGVSDTAKALQKVMQKEEGESDESIEMKDICKVIPLVPPQKAKELVDDNIMEENGVCISELIAVAPFLDSEYLEKLIEKADVRSLSEIVGLAPHMDDEALERLVLKADVKDLEGCIALAPFLNDEALDKLIENQIQSGQFCSTPELYPFLSDQCLKKLSSYFVEKNDLAALRELMPFC